jgi:tetratricopeptide (TPR) repeat protein
VLFSRWIAPWALLVVFAGPGSAQPLVTEPLPRLLERGARAFAAGDYAQAAAAFAQVERDYGREAEWSSGQLPRRLLPLKGFAELRSGAPAEASRSFERFLALDSDDARQRSFVLFALGMALRQQERPLDALRRLEEFEHQAHAGARIQLSQSLRAEILFSLNRPNEGLALLEGLASGAHAESFRAQARLRATQKALELGRLPDAKRLLLGAPWNVETMPEIAALAFAAMELGDALLEAGEAHDAIRCYRLVLPRERLIAEQRLAIGRLQRLLTERAHLLTGAGASFWADFYRGRLRQAEGLLSGLETGEDYTLPLRLRLGQALLLAGRPREAWLLFESVALDAAAPRELADDASYRWIVAALTLERWEDALGLARAFLLHRPESPLVPEAILLMAQAHFEQRRYALAIEAYNDLLARYPEHPLRPRAHFSRGYSLAMLERYAEAREEFAACRRTAPEGTLAPTAGLWTGLTLFFERRYREALEAFEAIAAENRRHRLYPEFRYRIATTKYALKELDQAKRELERFLKSYAQHPRHGEALILLGDTLMAQGELVAAMRTFAQAPSDTPALHAYATFQIGKILRAQGDFGDLAKHFTQYVVKAGGAGEPPPRLSEALYWIGWAQERLGDLPAAFVAFAEALDRFGDDPRAGEIGPALEALARLKSRGGELTSVNLGSPAGRLIAAATFSEWVEAERQLALLQERPAWHGRLTIWLAERRAKERRPAAEEALLLELAGAVPLEALDAEALAKVGRALQAIRSPSAFEAYRLLLERFPHAPARAAAYLGLAEHAADERRRDEAAAWLARLQAELPTHSLAVRGLLLSGELRLGGGLPEAASEPFLEVLRRREARGRPHAEALRGLALACAALGQRSEAIGYWQRLYTMHRAQADLVAEAYLESAFLFERLGDLPAALRSLDELLGAADLAGTEQGSLARERRVQLASNLPPP